MNPNGCGKKMCNQGQEADHDKQLQSEANNVDKFFTTRNNLARRVQDCRIKIRNIGALAREEYTKYFKN